MDKESTRLDSSAESVQLRCIQERERRDPEKCRDGLIADAVAFLISARASLQHLSEESACNPHAGWILALVSKKVFEAVSTLDSLSVAEWIKDESPVGIGKGFADLPNWWVCLDDLA